MSSLARWGPLDSLSMFDREMRRMMNHMFIEPSTMWEAPGGWRPAMDAYREGDEFVLRVELPDIDPESDLELTVEGDRLHVKGERSTERDIKKEDRFVQERLYGAFERVAKLPEGFDPETLRAVYDAGVLTVRVPYATTVEIESRRIPVEVTDKPKKAKEVVETPRKVA